MEMHVMADGPATPVPCTRHPTDREDGLRSGEESRAGKRARHGNAKLKAADVRAIRALSASGRSCAEVAREFGVAASTVSYIARGVSWKHLA